MRFVALIWRLMVGIKDAMVLILMLLFFGMLYVALSASPGLSTSARGALLVDLKGAIVELPASAEPLDVLSGGAAGREYRLRDIVNALDKAADDSRVQAVALDLDSFGGGGAVTLTDVGAALDRVRKANKPVIAFASTYTDDSYQLAAHASEVWLDPMGAVLIRGPGGTGLYYKGMLDKIGVTANVYRVGTYKAATEPFTRNDMSPEARESIQGVAGALWQTWLDDIRRARPKAQVAPYVGQFNARVGQAGGDMAKAAQQAGLVDRLGDRTEFGARIAAITGKGEDDVPGSFKTIKLTPWIKAHPASESGGNIGILTVAGEIVDGESMAGTAGGDTVRDTLYAGLDKQDLKALVVRVDSPGGSVAASEQIRRAVLEAKKKGLPVVVSMGSVAASGGYWIATAGDRILAEPGTITGSIGVFGILPSFQGTLEKLGLGADGVKTTPYSGEPDLLRGPSADADQLIQASVENVYRRFLGLVSAARRLPQQRVDQIAQGRIWDGGTARQLGLVDRFGSLDEAVAEAARLAKIEPADAKPVWLDKEPDFLEAMFAAFNEEEEDQASPDGLARVAGQPRDLAIRALLDAQRLLSGPVLQARCLDCPPAPVRAPTRRERSGLTAFWELLAG